jgi:hypothetical protein
MLRRILLGGCFLGVFPSTIYTVGFRWISSSSYCIVWNSWTVGGLEVDHYSVSQLTTRGANFGALSSSFRSPRILLSVIKTFRIFVTGTFIAGTFIAAIFNYIRLVILKGPYSKRRWKKKGEVECRYCTSTACKG